MPRPHWFWSVVKGFWPNYSHVAIAAFLVNVLGLAAPLFIMSVYDRVVPNGAIASLVALSIGMVLAIGFEALLRMVRSRIIDLTGKKIDVVLAANIFEHVLAVKLAQRPNSVGILANQLREFDSVREFFTSGSVVSATDLLFAILFVGVLYIIAGPLAFIPLAMLPIMILIGLSRSSFPWTARCAACRRSPRRVTASWSNLCRASRPCEPRAAKHACNVPGKNRSLQRPDRVRMSISGPRLL